MNGLTGEQGVIIPASTKPNLMLNPEVVEAIKNKKFHIYAVNHIEEAMEILTGKPFGTVKNGRIQPKDSISERITTRLQEYFDAKQKLK